MSNEIQSVVRAFQVLEVLSQEKVGLSLKDLAVQTGEHKSTVYRVLSTLASLGYVVQDALSGHYKISLSILNLGSMVLEEQEIIDVAKPYLVELSQKTDETIHLGAREQNEIIYIDKIESKGTTIRMQSYIGKKLPLHSTALGKVFLATMSAEEFDGFWAGTEHEKFTHATIVNKNKLLGQLDEIRISGYACDDEESEEGLKCFAAPIYDRNGAVIHAVSISSFKFKMTADKEKLYIASVCNAASKISADLGYRI